MVRDNPETFADLDGHFGSRGELAVTEQVDEELQQDSWTTRQSPLSAIFAGVGAAAADTYEKEEEPKAQQQSSASPLKDKNGNVVQGANGQPALIPSGFDVNAVIKAGKSDAKSLVHKAEDLANFRRGGKWDLQRLSGKFDPRFIDSATILIGIYAASADITRKHILNIENDVAITGSYPKGTKMDSTYTHLPVRNVRNTDIGMQLVISGAVP